MPRLRVQAIHQAIHALAALIWAKLLLCPFFR
jgi:hypothetical protein